MSFSNLISGAECALPANPLSQVLKHTESDRSLQQVRYQLITAKERSLTSTASGKNRGVVWVEGTLTHSLK